MNKGYVLNGTYIDLTFEIKEDMLCVEKRQIIEML